MSRGHLLTPTLAGLSIVILVPAGEIIVPFLQSEVQTLRQTLADNLLGALSARPAAALLVTPTVHLFTAGPAPVTPFNVPGDFTEATFAGYTAVVLTLPLLGPVNLPSGDGVGAHQEADFLAGAIVLPGETILGYWIDDGATAMYYSEIFATPVPFVFPGDFLSLDVIFAILNPSSAQ